MEPAILLVEACTAVAGKDPKIKNTEKDSPDAEDEVTPAAADDGHGAADAKVSVAILLP